MNIKCYPGSDVPAVSLTWLPLPSLLGDAFSLCVWHKEPQPQMKISTVTAINDSSTCSL